jgi:hypothetical protein
MRYSPEIEQLEAIVFGRQEIFTSLHTLLAEYLMLQELQNL